MGFSVLLGLSHQQLELVLSMGTADMLEERTLFSLVLDYLDGSRSGPRKVVYPTKSVRDGLRLLQHGGVVAVLGDQSDPDEANYG